jgi:hypothetical protein
MESGRVLEMGQTAMNKRNYTSTNEGAKPEEDGGNRER